MNEVFLFHPLFGQGVSESQDFALSMKYTNKGVFILTLNYYFASF